MKKDDNFYNKYLSGKPLLLLHYMASLTACSLIIYIAIGIKLDFYHQLANMFILLLIGFVLGITILLIDKKNKLVNYNRLNFIIKQPIYAIVIITFIYLFKLEHMSLKMSVVLSIYFLVGLACAIFDYRQIDLKKYLFLGFVPIIISLSYYVYFSKSVILNEYIMYSALFYFCSLLLVLNRVKLDRVIYSSKSINLRNKYRIRVKNDIKIIIMFFGFLTTLIVLKYSTALNRVCNQFINWFFGLFPHFGESEAIYDNFEQPVFELPKSASGIEKSIFIIIIAVIAIALFISIIFVLIMIIKYLIAKSKRVQLIRKKYKSIIMKSDEFEEESEIVNSKNKKRSRRMKNSFMYDLNMILKEDDKKMKIRYLYGYNLEQMLYYGLDIKKAQTPLEILNAVNSNKIGKSYSSDYFLMITNEYIKTRYGDKIPSISFINRHEIKKYQRTFCKYLKKATG